MKVYRLGVCWIVVGFMRGFRCVKGLMRASWQTMFI